MAEAAEGKMPETGERGGAMLDIALVVAASGAVFMAELYARGSGLLPLGPESTGIFGVLSGALVALALVMTRGPGLPAIGFRRPRRLWTWPFWAVGILSAYVGAQIILPGIVGSYFDLPALDLSRYDALYRNLPATLLAAAIVPFTAAIPEEVIYRGFLMERLSRLFGKGPLGWALVVLLQGVLFGLVHFQWGLGGMVFTSIMGVIWGAAFLMCGRNLWIVIAAHGLGDVLLVVQLYFVKGSEIGAG